MYENTSWPQDFSISIRHQQREGVRSHQFQHNQPVVQMSASIPSHQWLEVSFKGRGVFPAADYKSGPFFPRQLTSTPPPGQFGGKKEDSGRAPDPRLRD